MKYVLLATFVIVSIATTLATESFWHEQRLVDIPLHAGLEALGGLSAVVIAVFLLQRQGEAPAARRLPLAMSFLCMGVLDTFHAVSPPGHGFVLLRSVASLAGGSWLALTWLPDRWIRHRILHSPWLPYGVAFGVVSFGSWTLAAQQSLPVMTRGDAFTTSAVTLNALAGLLFLAGAARLLIDFHRSGSFETYLLAFIATMFGLAGILFTASALWDPTWWLWHVLRVTAYGGALVFAFREYYGTVADLRVLSLDYQAAAARLQDGEIRYRTLFEQSPDGILLIDPSTMLPVEFNDTTCRQLGYRRDEFASLRIPDYEAAETTEDTKRHLATVMTTGHDSFETRHRTKQGEIKAVFVTVQKIELSGQPVLHCIFRDVTQAHEQAALARIGEMAAVIAHEVKNPLAGVRGAIQVIGRRLGSGSQDAAIIDQIIARIDALNDLMKDLLFFARPPQVHLASIDVVALAKETLVLLSQDPTAQSVRVEVEGSAPAVMADAKLLNIVLLNLLLNAAQAMQAQGSIRISVTSNNQTCRITVTDAGPGIPPDIRERIFTPFFTTKSRGTGLGLPTAKRLVEAHHGRISVSCPPDGGTIVVIELPC